MGFSIATIVEIHGRHETQCGTREQREANLDLVNREFASIAQQQADLARRTASLKTAKKELEQLLG
ncbi:hypothetical protein BACT_1432 [Bifidobacterium actinocoloniiforme DSM 22766]|uniref:Uncharacterized protein n=1 Tax=Bifidobacterium actinocoloniiforme DSM 22766 TaxID=1437605 RepID=A0A086Z2H5_9BIFI|nr:hypothetical protein [Bifidobacterium actinocoloniiforme]AKV55717.1 hypothetical protein AB656_05460 [Bifidobacterium actinocoloniiforme DSM 22766]KFI40725.1 hypothetical protein BACT_1432 [Bifidobacterium actinocoloniiforme DSM 22766]